MKNYILRYKQDCIFKLIFGNKDNLDLLTVFLSSALKIPLASFDKIVVRDPNLQVAFPEVKLLILDLCIETEGQIIDVEIFSSRWRGGIDHVNKEK